MILLGAFAAGVVLLFWADYRYRKHFKKDEDLFVRWLHKKNGATK